MIDSKYAVDCLRQGFERYIRYKKIDATIDIGSNYVSFYVKDFDNTGKQYMARTSTHHLKMQRIADKDEPWKGDNISIAFITPKSKQDSQVRATVRQNAQGTIQPFDITTYQYNNTILDESDLSDIFHSIVSFLNGQGYSDPFKGTAKQAKVLSRHSNIKPYKVPATHTNISIDSNNNNRITTKNGYGADYVSESKDIYNNNDIKTENYMRNNKRTIRLTESDLHRVIKESVKRVLNENDYPFDLNKFHSLVQDGYEHIEAALGILSEAQEMTRSKEDPMKGSTYHLDDISEIVGLLLNAKHKTLGLGAKSNDQVTGAVSFVGQYD